MGSHQRRSHVKDRKRNLPKHVLEVEAEHARMEEKRRKNRKHKRLQRARERGEVDDDPSTPATLPSSDEHGEPSLSTPLDHDFVDPSDATASHDVP